jgi:hypothetical protein
MRLACAAVGLLVSSCATISQQPTALDAMQALAAEEEASEPIDPQQARNAFVGGMLGTGAGIAAGAALSVGVMVANADEPDDEGTPGIIIAWMTFPPAGALVGAIVGALIGWGDDEP